MRVSLLTLRLLLGMLTFSLLTACDDSSSSSSSSDTINTFNLYFSNNTIFAYNPDTEFSRGVDSFNTGVNQLFSLDTDIEKQGFEFLSYVKDHEVYILSYEKPEEGKTNSPIRLVSAVGDICGIYPEFTAPQSIFDGDNKNQRIVLHKASIILETGDAVGCTPENNVYSRISIELKDGLIVTKGIEITTIGASEHLGDTIFDYAFKPTLDQVDEADEKVKPGQVGYLGYDLDGSQLNMRDGDGNVLWDTPFPYTNQIPTIKQVTQTQVLVQSDGKLFVVDATNLFNVAAAGTDDDGKPQIPNASKIAEQFKTATLDTTNTDISTIPFSSNDTNFVIEVDDKLYMLDQASTKTTFKEIFSKPDITDTLEFTILTNNNVVVLINKEINKEILLHINTKLALGEGEDNIKSASEISYFVQGNDIYFNTLDANGWNAHWRNEGGTIKDFTNSMLIFAESHRTPAKEGNPTQDVDIFLLSSNGSQLIDRLEMPELYAFDRNRITGRKQARDSNHNLVDFSFGEITSDISNIETESVIEGSATKVINDQYGTLRFKTPLDSILYYFNPTQEKTSEILSNGQNNTASLKLIQE